MAIHHRTKTISRIRERRLLAGISVLFLLLFGSLYYNLQPQLRLAEQGYADGGIVNLADPLDQRVLSVVLQKGNYINDRRDVAFLVKQLTQKLHTKGKLTNLGELNKKSFTIPIEQVENQPGPDYRSRVQASRMALGFIQPDKTDDMAFDSLLFFQESSRPQPHKSVVSAGNGVLSMAGIVKADSTEQPVAGVLVRLQQHFAKDTTAPSYYARTDAKGTFRFEGLPDSTSFSVLPLRPHYEFGSSQGIELLTKNEEFEFTAKPHKLRLLGSNTFQQLKEDKTLTVRTPDDFRAQFLTWTLLFVIAFWLVHLFWSARGFEGDPMILPLLMLLTGISVLTMFAIQDPLRDTLRGNETVQGVGLGLVALTVLSQLNVGLWYTTHWFDALAFWRKSTFNQIGYTWLIAAFGLTMVVALFGYGPEGSNVKVNLNLGFVFQPSEITKYLVLIYFAGYFTANAEYLRQVPDLQWRIKNSFSIFVLFALILGIYLYLGDMGPALVLCFTFLLFYAAARGDFGFMVFGATIYGAMLYVGSLLGITASQKLPLFAITLLYVLLWLGYGIFKKDYKESALYVVILIAAFVFGEMLPKAGQRLADRNSMFLNQWDNEIQGGDQVAHGIWSLASGGLTGQGLGKGFSKVMPANHTDMILPSIGEELGLFGLLAIFIGMGVLLHRTLLIARRNAQPFSFYLAAGIALITGAQFLLMASGSMGTVPLTGVSVPFLSFGRVGMIINMAVFGIVMSVSAKAGSTLERDYIQTRFDRIIGSGSLTFLLTIAKFVVLVLLPYQVFKASNYIVKPAIVANRNGERIISINPRINILARELGAGTIYDRNGLLLATSNKDNIDRQKDSLTNAGASQVAELRTKRLSRYYPFGEHLFFWVGDFNNRLMANSANGYLAEFKHLAALRGFSTSTDQEKPLEVQSEATRYRENRFLPRHSQQFTLSQYDYSALSPLLRAGIDSRAVTDFKARNRDIQLTVDAELQTKMQQAMQNAADFKDKRISVVVLNAATGEVLASAVNPLPDMLKIKQLLDIPKDQQKFITATTQINGTVFTEKDLGMTYETPPGSTAKILTGFAAMNRLGTAGARVTYAISPNEIIRKTGGDPDPTGSVDMRTAIVHSSNVYFIRMANEHSLDPEMQALYEAVGMRLGGRGGYHFSIDSTRFTENRPYWKRNVFDENRQFYTDSRRIGTKKRYFSEFSQIAWGQGKLEATPLALGRMAGVIANNGILQPSTFIRTENGRAVAPKQVLNLAQKPNIAGLMQEFMAEQSKGKITDLKGLSGKTGTPERDVTLSYLKDKEGRYLKDRKGNLRKDFSERNDAWYVFFAPSPLLNNAPLVTVVRIERLKGEGSGKAVQLANKVLMSILRDTHYFPQTNQ